MRQSKLIQEIVIIDPDSGGEVEVCIFKHENGGLFGMDSSFIEQVLDEDGDAVLTDPFSKNGLSEDFEQVILEGV
jgi:hypothetical protein